MRGATCALLLPFLLALPSAAAQAAGTVALVDLACAAAPDEATGEFVELENLAPEPADLSGWRLVAHAPGAATRPHHVFPEGFMLAGHARRALPIGPDADDGWRRPDGALRDEPGAGDGLRLLTPGGEFAHEALCADFAARCPRVDAAALDDGSVRLTMDASEKPPRWRVYRADATGERYHEIAAVSGIVTAFVDASAPRGADVRYVVTSEADDARSRGCAAVALTTAAERPLAHIVAVAGVSAVGAYAWLRARR